MCTVFFFFNTLLLFRKGDFFFLWHFSVCTQPRLCHSRTSGDLGWNATGWSQHQFHQQPILWLHHHKAGWKVRNSDHWLPWKCQTTAVVHAYHRFRSYLHCCCRIRMTWKCNRSDLLDEITSINEEGKESIKLTGTNCATAGLPCASVWSSFGVVGSTPRESNKAPLVLA